MADTNQIQLFQSVDGQIQRQVSLDQDTVWLTQAQMCELFNKNKRTGSFLFLWYLRNNEHLLAKPVEWLVNDNTLVGL